MSFQSVAMRMSQRLYRALLHAYPRTFRSEFGGEMTAMFDELASQAVRESGIAGLLSLWSRMVRDVAISAPREQWDDVSRSISMKSTGLALLSVVLAAFLYWSIIGAMATTYLLWRLQGADPVTPGAFTLTQAALCILFASMLTGFILQCVTPFPRPKLTAPLGIMLLACAVAPTADGRLPMWVGFAIIPVLGFSALVGCVLSNAVQVRLAKPTSSAGAFPSAES